MKTIWKYKLEITDNQIIVMPFQSKILSVHTQYGHPHIWVECDPHRHGTEEIRIMTFGTGQPISEVLLGKLRFIGTYLMHNDSLVFHVYVLEGEPQ